MYFKLFLILFILNVNLSYQEEVNKPIIQDLFVSSKLIEGKKLFLSCQISSGLLPLQFEWYFDQEKLLQNDNVYISNQEETSLLNIRSMKTENSGKYTCQVSNSFGSDSKEVNLQLNGKSVIFKLKPLNK